MQNKSTPKNPALLVFMKQGVAHIDGTRLSVAQIISTWKQNDYSSALTADYLEMSPDIIKAALGYYEENSARIDREVIKIEEAQK